MNIEYLAKKIVSDQESPEDYEKCSKALSCDLPALYNEISIYFARSFMSGSLSYEDADFAMNGVWSSMLDYIMKKDAPMVEPCYSIYCAFDEGEYDHRDGCDPVEKYTKPALEKLLQAGA